jgi:hypothetical protein
MAKHSVADLIEHSAQKRIADGERYFAKAFELAADGDHEAAQRFMGYALYQVERLFCVRKRFKLEAK